MSSFSRVLVLAGFLAAGLLTARAQPPAPPDDTPPPPAREPLARFAYTGEGCILLPVEMPGGKSYLFMLDTGASATVYDTSLRAALGAAVETVEVETPEGTTRLSRHQAPEARLGKLNLRSDASVFVSDLRPMREASGFEIYGMIGMDFLVRHVVRLDADRKEVSFWPSVPADSGERLPLWLQPSGCPMVGVRIPGLAVPEPFCIDTGMGGGGAGHIRQEVYQVLLGQGKIRSAGQGKFTCISETCDKRRGRVETFAVGENRHTGLIFDESKSNLLGFGYWCRYAMTLDFPHGALYLKKGKRYDKPDRKDMSGLTILLVRSRTTVLEVGGGSPGAQAGIQARDELVEVNGRPSAETNLMALRELLCEEGQTVRLVVRRGVVERRVSLTLREWGADAPGLTAQGASR